MKVALYARVSSDPLGDLSSVTRQLADLRQLAGLRGDEVSREFIDDNESAYRRAKPRPAFAKLQEFVRTGEVQAIYVWHPDRLYRSLRDLEDIVDLVEQHDVVVCTVRAGLIDLSNATGRLVARLVGATARYESEHKGERLSRKFAETAAKGEPPANAKGFGYLPGLLVHNQLEAEALRSAAQMVLSGNQFPEVTKAVSRMLGYKVPSYTLRDALTSYRTAGLRNYVTAPDRRRGVKTGTISEGTWPAILDHSTWLQVRSLLERTGKGRSRTGYQKYLLSRLLVCGICGNPLAAGGLNYRCSPAWSGCQKVAVSRSNADHYMTDWVLHPSHPRWMRARLDEIERMGEASPRFQGVEQRRNELAALFGQGRITANEWQTARDHLARQTHLPELLDVSLLREHDLLKRGLEVLQRWESATLDEQRTAIGTVLGKRRGIIAPRGKGSPFDPSRISVIEPATADPSTLPAVVGVPADAQTGGSGLNDLAAVAVTDGQPLDLEREHLLRVISTIEGHRRAASVAISHKVGSEHTGEANRLILQLREAGTSGAEIGRLLGISREAVRQRLEAGRATRAEIKRMKRGPRKHRLAEMMTPGEAAFALGVTYAGLQRLAREGQIDYLKLPGSHPRYARASVNAWLESHAQGTSIPPTGLAESSHCPPDA